MKIKGQTIREGKELLPGTLYRTVTPATIVFTEKDTNDIVNINFQTKNGQYGIFGNEYKPPFVETEGIKKADILALVIDEKNQCFSSWIFDVKKTVGGEDVIYHLVDQIKESVKHKKSITTYIEEFAEDQHIGYITHELQHDRINETIVKKRECLEQEKLQIQKMPVLVATAANLKLLKEQAKLKVLMLFQNDLIEIADKRYQLECGISVLNSENKYVYDLNVFCS